MRLPKIDEIKYSFQNLGHRKMRSFLSALSILIGIMAVFALVSFGLGIKSYVDDLAKSAGTDKLFMQAKGIGAPGVDDTFFISQDDIDFISKINGVKEIAGMNFMIVEMESRGMKKYTTLIGMDMSMIDFLMQGMNIEIEKGRELKEGDTYKIVAGYNLMMDDKVFSKGLKTGDKILVDSVQFDIVGFYSEVGSPPDDAQVYVTKEMFEELYPEKKDKYSFVIASAEEGIPPNELAEKITERLRKHKGLDKGKEDFYIQSMEDYLETFGTVINILNGVLVLIALISVFVASVNIMNTMYTSVLERTKEIGLMKAVGARNSDILVIFILESGAIGMIGGIFGVFLGYLVASAGGAIAAGAGYALLKPVFPWTLIAGCILFSFIVGAGSGVMPAIRASKLRPVDALRYE